MEKKRTHWIVKNEIKVRGVQGSKWLTNSHSFHSSNNIGFACVYLVRAMIRSPHFHFFHSPRKIPMCSLEHLFTTANMELKNRFFRCTLKNTNANGILFYSLHRNYGKFLSKSTHTQSITRCHQITVPERLRYQLHFYSCNALLM